jgi:hypothetical protein
MHTALLCIACAWGGAIFGFLIAGLFNAVARSAPSSDGNGNRVASHLIVGRAVPKRSTRIERHLPDLRVISKV